MDIDNLKDEQLIQEHYQDLLKYCTRSNKHPEFMESINKAFLFAKEAHKGVRRKSGEPYILHPIEVARICAKEMGLGTKSIVSALLHDVVEDTDYTVEDIESMFGSKVASIVDGLTKLSGVIGQQKSLQAENFRKMLLTLSDDLRVILIKIADRLHNMRTLESMPLRKQMKIAGETLYMFAPLAHRMGLYSIKTELEDLSLRYEHPKEYNKIAQKLKNRESEKIELIENVIAPIKLKLSQNNITNTVINRSRSVFSIWNKMNNNNMSFEETYDLMSFRIVFKAEEGIPEKNQCWNIYSLITDVYKPKPERIRDWVSTPKTNGYEALHLTVMGPHGRWVEFQIRTQRMDFIADRGFAKHKTTNNSKLEQESQLDKWLKDVREVLDNPQSDALEFLDEFKLNLFSKEIQVFTPKGDIHTLPKNATALDLAYYIHTEIGNSAIGAKINHKLVSLSHKLKSGDQVEILTSDKQIPKAEWASFVITAKAKSKIKDLFKSQRKEFIKKGTNIVDDFLASIDYKLNAKTTRKMLEHFNETSKDELFYKIGCNKLHISDIEIAVKRKSKNKFIKYWKLNFFGQNNKAETLNPIDKKKVFMLNSKEENKSQYNFATCCQPIPGDDVVGYIEDNNSITIHKRKCETALKLMYSQGDKLVEADWKSEKKMSFLAVIKLGGIDKIGIVNNITGIISDDHLVNMRSVHFESHDGIFDGLIHLYVSSSEDLNNLIGELIKINGIENVQRIENQE